MVICRFYYLRFFEKSHLLNITVEVAIKHFALIIIELWLTRGDDRGLGIKFKISLISFEIFFVVHGWTPRKSYQILIDFKIQCGPFELSKSRLRWVEFFINVDEKPWADYNCSQLSTLCSADSQLTSEREIINIIHVIMICHFHAAPTH